MIIKQKTIAILIVIVVALAAFFIIRNLPSANDPDKVLATANGIPVTQGDVSRAQQYLQALSGAPVNESIALERAIMDKLVYEEAEKQGYTMTSEETEQALLKILEAKSQTLEDLKLKIESKGENYEDEIENYRQQFLIEKFINDKVPKENVTTQEALKYYNANKQKLFTGKVAVPYAQIAEPLKLAIAKQKGQEFLTAYLTELHDNATIVYMKD